MRIAIDVREATMPQKAGKGQWTHGFVQELLTRGVEVVLVTREEPPTAWSGAAEIVRVSSRGLSWHLRVRSILTSRTDIDLYLSPTSFLVPALVGYRVRCVPIVHDLIAFQPGRHEWKARMMERWTLGRALRTAHHVCTVSDATRRDLCDRFPSLSPSRVTTIYAGPGSSTQKNTPDGATILCVGTLCPRKNQERLIRAFASLPDALRSSWRLVLVGGRGWDDRAIIRLASETQGVEWRQYLGDEELQRLYRTATCAALPSLYEGFGMAVLDAMTMGIPVLTSARGSLSEVAGAAAVYVDPESVDSIAAGLTRLMTQPTLRAELHQKALLQAKKFSWKRTVDLFLAAVGC